MANSELKAAPRTVLGKKVAQLRRTGVTPANIFGHKIESKSIQADTVELVHLLRQSSRNAIINMKVDGESAPRTVVVRDLKRNAVTDQLLHVDFYQISMTQKMRADVPVVLFGISDAVTTFGGVLLQMTEKIAVEALPGDIPVQFDVDVSKITELEGSLHVRDLDVDASKVTLHTELDVVLARVASPRVVVEETPVAAEGAVAAPAAGAAPAAPATPS
ncbi:MAG: 50S ribosomal protein L25 [Chloroflexota bacterium]